MSELGLADRLKLLRSKRAESSSIVQSRKRKLRELFAVATDEDAIPNHDFSNPDAPPITPAEAKFLIDCDILQSRRLNELNIPARRKPLFDARLLRAISESAAIENVSYAGPAKSTANRLSSLPAEDAKLNGLKSDSGTIGGHASPRAVSKVLPANEASYGAEGPEAIPYRRDGTPGNLSAKDAHGQANGVSIEPGRNQVLSRATLSPLDDSPPSSKSLRIDSQVSRVDQAPLPMELDERPSPQDADSVGHRSSFADPSRYHDAMSSPGSTAQSMRTPAVHDVSANTSPDNEGPQYLERGDDLSEDKHETSATSEKRDESGSWTAPSMIPPVLDVPLGSTISSVEAQLLQESAAASLSQQPGPVTISVPPHDGTKRTEQAVNNTLSAPVAGDGPLAHQQASLAAPRTLATTRGQNQHVLEKPSEPSDRTSPISENTGVGAKTNECATVPMDIDKPDVLDLPGAAQPRQPDILQGVSTEDPTRASRTMAATVPKPSLSIPPANMAALREPSTKPQSAVISTSPTEPPKPVTGNANTSRATQSEETTEMQTPSASQLKLLANKARDRRRRSVPTVIFGKQPSKPKPTDDGSLVVSRPRPGQIPSEDYFTPLFIEGFTRQSTWMKPIEKLLNQAHKTISTSDQYISILDHQACKILRRVYHLQQHDKWSLRQPVRCPEPTRPSSHWDVTLQEMKWMRTDFREERKWKRAVARNLAHSCAEWVHSSAAERLALQVNAVIPPRPVAEKGDGDTAGSLGFVEEALPDLVHSDSPMGDDDDGLEMLVETVAPSAIFALQDDEVIFNLQPSKAADLLLENLPMHGSPLQVPKFDVSGTDYDPDAKWKRPAIPLSKFVEGEMVLACGGPPRKRRRYDYLAEDEDDDDVGVTFGSGPDHGAELQAENNSVALFNPEMKTIRDRLHAGHQFRPPTEHPMPPQSFFECRTASQWTWGEDEQLKALVRECSYNWSLISSMASTTSTFASGAERRTPWECFERWVSLGSLEGLPNDMARTPYFKAYQSRIDAAQRAIAQQNQTAQQQVGPNGAVTPVLRRRATTSIRVERRRHQKHLALIDAMRKLAKKRETAAQKAQHAANLAAMRKANEVPRQQSQNKTPRDYSIMRWERDQALAERMAAYALRHADANARRLKQTQGVPIPGTPGALPVPQSAAQIAAANSLNTAARLNVPGQLAMAGQTRTPGRVPIQTPPGAVPAAVQARLAGGLVPPLQMAGIPQAQLQAMQQQAAAQHRMPMVNPQPDIGLMLQARSIQNQQRAAIQLQQQQQAQQQPQQGQQQQQQQQQQILQPQQQVAQQQQQQQHPQQQQQQVTQPSLPQTSQQTPQLGQPNGTQGSPTPMRNVVNGLNQGAFLNNAQAMMASFNAANSAGLVTSPGAGLSMPPIPGRSPGGILSHHITQRLAELEGHYRAKHPNMAPETIRQLATEHLGRMIVQSQQQAAMNAAAGGVAQQSMNSPHQYASLLRAQQQAQAQQAAQQQAQQAAQQQGAQHQRQGSGSATPAGK